MTPPFATLAETAMHPDDHLAVKGLPTGISHLRYLDLFPYELSDLAAADDICIENDGKELKDIKEIKHLKEIKKDLTPRRKARKEGRVICQETISPLPIPDSEPLIPGNWRIPAAVAFLAFAIELTYQGEATCPGSLEENEAAPSARKRTATEARRP